MEFTIDRQNGVIRGAKVLGPISRNKRRYPNAARRDVIRLAEGKPVRMKHGNDAYDSTVGWVQDLREENDTVYGDFHLKPHHPLRENILWDAENKPQEFGLSIDAEGRVGRPDKSGWRDVTKVEKVGYVALVTDPATATSIRESFEEPDMDLATLKSDHPELVEKLIEEYRASQVNDEQSKQEKAKLIRERDEALAKLQESENKLGEYQKAEQRAARRSEIEKEAAELKAGDISEELMESYLDLKPETVTAFLKEIAKRPIQESVEKPAGAKSSDGTGAETKARRRGWWAGETK